MKETEPKIWPKILKDWRFGIAVLLLGSIVWALESGQGKSIAEAWEAAKDFPLSVLGIAFLLCTSQILCMGMRTWCLTPPKTPLFWVLWAISYGQLANAFLPARAGEALKVAVLGDKKKKSAFSYSEAVGILFSDKILDLLGLVTFLLVIRANTVDALMPDYRQWDFKILLYVLVAHVLIFVTWRFYLKERLPRIDEKLKQIRSGMRRLKDVRHTLPSLFFAVSTWSCEILTLHFLSGGLGYSISLAEAGACILVLNLAISIPISVANLGAFEASIAYALGKLGVALHAAIAIAVVHHLLQLLGTLTATGISRFFSFSLGSKELPVHPS